MSEQQQNGNIKRNLPYIFLIVIILGFGFYRLYLGWYIPSQIKRATQTPEGSKNSAGEAVSDDDSPDNGSQEDVNSERKCRARNLAEDIYILESRLPRFLSAGSFKELIMRNRICYQVGTSISIYTFRHENGFIYQLDYRGEGTVKSVVLTKPLQALTDRDLSLLKDETEFVQQWTKNVLKKDIELMEKNVQIVDIQITSLKKSLDSYGTPKKIYGVQVVNKAEVERMLTSKVPIFDLRPNEFFAKEHIPGAINLPYAKFGMDLTRLMSPNQVAPHLLINWENLPTDKRTKFIIYSQCAADYLTTHAAVLLRKAGYRNILWMRGGYEEWLGKTCMTPSETNYASVVNADQVLQLMANGGVLADIRVDNHLIPISVKGAINLPFRQKVGPLFLPKVRNWNMTIMEVNQNDENFTEPVSLDKNKVIILFGKDDFDYRPLKAAIRLRNLGYNKVYWYRLGIMDWINRSYFEPQKYMTVSTLVEKK